MNTDTELLRKLVDACEKEFCSPVTERGEFRQLDEDEVMGPTCEITFGMIRQARIALSRLLEAQEGMVPAEWLNKVARYTRHGVMAYPGAEEQWIRADAIDALIEDATRAHPPSEGEK